MVEPEAQKEEVRTPTPELDLEDSSERSPPKDESTPTLSTFQTFVLIFALCASTFLAALDITIITTSLPTISAHFRSTAAYVWIGAAYMLGDGASTPIWSKVSDIWGRKVILLIAIAVFFVGSTLCATAPSMTMLIAGRAIQGTGGGGLLNLTSIVISDLFSLRDRGKYYGFIGMTWALASSLGPLLGGALTQQVSWRWCFYINLPITALVFVIVVFFLHLETPKTPLVAGLKSMDWFGAFTFVGATVMLLLGLNFGGVEHPWSSATVLCLLVFSGLTFILFLLIEYRVARNPIIPFAVFNTTATSMPLLACLFHGFVLVICSYFLPLYFQSVLGARPLLSGVWILPLACSMGFAAALAGGAISATGKYLIFIRVGFALMTLGCGLLIILPHSRSWAGIVIYQLLIGAGVGPNFQALLVALQSSVHASDSGTATATFGFVRNIATSVGIVTGEVVFQNIISKQYSKLAASLNPSLAASIAHGSAESSIFLLHSLPPAQKTLARDAFYTSLRAVWIYQTALAGAGLLVILFISGKELSQEHQVVRTGLDAEAGRAEMARRNREGKKKTAQEQEEEEKARGMA